ncbi:MULTISPECIES: DeoR family transcriptional regulator [unclassified Fusobacterium]|nr:MULTISPECIES: DeoR family transcriptional regulator [unclassified Fusobacterium]
MLIDQMEGVKTSELVEIFEVSLESIRRDFDALKKELKLLTK